MNATEPRPEEWWRDFYEGPFGEMQVAGLFEDKVTQEVDFIEKALGLTPGCEVLDVPCGPGRHSVELAVRGYKVTGVDFNERVLDRTGEKAAERGVSVALHRQDMRALTFNEQFDAAICFWGSFGYFDEAGDRAFAEGALRSPKPGGRFLLETHSYRELCALLRDVGFPQFRRVRNDVGRPVLRGVPAAHVAGNEVEGGATSRKDVRLRGLHSSCRQALRQLIARGRRTYRQ